MICRFNFPVRVITNNGVQLYTLLGIQHQRTPLHHPRSNLSEPVNHTLRPLLASLAHYDSKSWNVKLAQIAFALRIASHDSTGASPVFLMFG